MPRGWRPKPTEKERLDAVAAETETIIRTAMAQQGIRHMQDLAALIGMKRSTLYQKIERKYWTQRDLCSIITALKIPASDAVKMLGVKM